MRSAIISATLLLLTTAAAAQLPTEPLLATPRGPTSQILISAAGATGGVNGAFFRSDVAVYNYRSADQAVLIQWLPQGLAGTPASGRTITIPARTVITSDDFVTIVVQQTGLGAILITGVRSDGTPDSGALLEANSRIWVRQELGNGTLSQSLPCLATSDINNSAALTIIGQRLDGQYRTNVGVVNLDTTASRTFDIGQNTSNPNGTPVITTITVPPFSMVQVPLPPTGAPILQIRVTPRGAIDPRLWTAYGSTADNLSGDSWSSIGFIAPAAP
jgi:hypothetical protein